MRTRTSSRLFLITAEFLVLLIPSHVLLAQGRSAEAFERVREVHERNIQRLMAIKDVEGTAIGHDRNDQLSVKVFTARPGVGNIPESLDGVPVDIVVTGKFYALPKGGNGKGGGSKAKGPKDREPPAFPIGLTATAVSDSRIDLSWDHNPESDLAFYNIYGSTSSGGPYSHLASVVSNVYSDMDLAASMEYYYLVTAVDSSNNESADSDEASARTMDSSGEPGEPADPPIGPRPAPIGVSTGHPNITAGTIACRVTDGTHVYALSNNHVYADENAASIDDNVLQPGAYDGGQDPRDAIGTLSDFEPIAWYPFGLNTIDAAIALTSADQLGSATPSDGYGTPKSTVQTPYLGMTVQKYGRTTGLTIGQVTAVNATLQVGYDSGTAVFTDQIIISGSGSFSAGGDSGSLVVTKSDNPDDDKKPVGLLFAGSSTMTVANPIDLVLDRFGVTIDGQ